MPRSWRGSSAMAWWLRWTRSACARSSRHLKMGRRPWASRPWTPRVGLPAGRRSCSLRWAQFLVMSPLACASSSHPRRRLLHASAMSICSRVRSSCSSAMMRSTRRRGSAVPSRQLPRRPWRSSRVWLATTAPRRLPSARSSGSSRCACRAATRLRWTCRTSCAAQSTTTASAALPGLWAAWCAVRVAPSRSLLTPLLSERA
mmetsp:Transcript_85527/g.220191  ORF Transcript_85527/g.220191 Transcript_85527/m.220191 type:complete len:202 (-) Transcript_85527:325-930(-)